MSNYEYASNDDREVIDISTMIKFDDTIVDFDQLYEDPNSNNNIVKLANTIIHLVMRDNGNISRLFRPNGKIRIYVQYIGVNDELNVTKNMGIPITFQYREEVSVLSQIVKFITKFCGDISDCVLFYEYIKVLTDIQTMINTVRQDVQQVKKIFEYVCTLCTETYLVYKVLRHTSQRLSETRHAVLKQYKLLFQSVFNTLCVYSKGEKTTDNTLYDIKYVLTCVDVRNNYQYSMLNIDNYKKRDQLYTTFTQYASDVVYNAYDRTRGDGVYINFRNKTALFTNHMNRYNRLAHDQCYGYYILNQQDLIDVPSNEDYVEIMNKVYMYILEAVDKDQYSEYIDIGSSKVIGEIDEESQSLMYTNLLIHVIDMCVNIILDKTKESCMIPYYEIPFLIPNVYIVRYCYYIKQLINIKNRSITDHNDVFRENIKKVSIYFKNLIEVADVSSNILTIIPQIITRQTTVPIECLSLIRNENESISFKETSFKGGSDVANVTIETNVESMDGSMEVVLALNNYDVYIANGIYNYFDKISKTCNIKYVHTLERGRNGVHLRLVSSDEDKEFIDSLVLNETEVESYRLREFQNNNIYCGILLVVKHGGRVYCIPSRYDVYLYMCNIVMFFMENNSINYKNQAVYDICKYVILTAKYCKNDQTANMLMSNLRHNLLSQAKMVSVYNELNTNIDTNNRNDLNNVWGIFLQFTKCMLEHQLNCNMGNMSIFTADNDSDIYTSNYLYIQHYFKGHASTYPTYTPGVKQIYVVNQRLLNMCKQKMGVYSKEPCMSFIYSKRFLHIYSMLYNEHSLITPIPYTFFNDYNYTCLIAPALRNCVVNNAICGLLSDKDKKLLNTMMKVLTTSLPVNNENKFDTVWSLNAFIGKCIELYSAKSELYKLAYMTYVANGTLDVESFVDVNIKTPFLDTVHKCMMWYNGKKYILITLYIGKNLETSDLFNLTRVWNNIYDVQNEIYFMHVPSLVKLLSSKSRRQEYFNMDYALHQLTIMCTDYKHRYIDSSENEEDTDEHILLQTYAEPILEYCTENLCDFLQISIAGDYNSDGNDDECIDINKQLHHQRDGSSMDDYDTIMYKSYMSNIVKHCRHLFQILLGKPLQDETIYMIYIDVLTHQYRWRHVSPSVRDNMSLQDNIEYLCSALTMEEDKEKEEEKQQKISTNECVPPDHLQTNYIENNNLRDKYRVVYPHQFITTKMNSNVLPCIFANNFFTISKPPFFTATDHLWIQTHIHKMLMLVGIDYQHHHLQCIEGKCLYMVLKILPFFDTDIIRRINDYVRAIIDMSYSHRYDIDKIIKEIDSGISLFIQIITYEFKLVPIVLDGDPSFRPYAYHTGCLSGNSLGSKWSVVEYILENVFLVVNRWAGHAEWSWDVFRHTESSLISQTSNIDKRNKDIHGTNININHITTQIRSKIDLETDSIMGSLTRRDLKLDTRSNNYGAPESMLAIGNDDNDIRKQKLTILINGVGSSCNQSIYPSFEEIQEYGVALNKRADVVCWHDNVRTKVCDVPFYLLRSDGMPLSKSRLIYEMFVVKKCRNMLCLYCKKPLGHYPYIGIRCDNNYNLNNINPLQSVINNHYVIHTGCFTYAVVNGSEKEEFNVLQNNRESYIDIITYPVCVDNLNMYNRQKIMQYAITYMFNGKVDVNSSISANIDLRFPYNTFSNFVQKLKRCIQMEGVTMNDKDITIDTKIRGNKYKCVKDVLESVINDNVTVRVFWKYLVSSGNFIINEESGAPLHTVDVYIINNYVYVDETLYKQYQLPPSKFTIDNLITSTKGIDSNNVLINNVLDILGMSDLSNCLFKPSLVLLKSDALPFDNTLSLNIARLQTHRCVIKPIDFIYAIKSVFARMVANNLNIEYDVLRIQSRNKTISNMCVAYSLL